MVEMKVEGLTLDPLTNMPIIILKDSTGQKALPIWVGIFEANAIALEIESITTPRPMTHDLLKNVVLSMQGEIKHILVNELKDNTFHAMIAVNYNGNILNIDSRPSDALALAVRFESPVFVEDAVIDENGIEFEKEDFGDEAIVDEFKEFLDQVNPEDFQGG